MKFKHLADSFISIQVPNYLRVIFWFTRFSLIAHFIEGLIAFTYSPSREAAPLPYAIYTFFVGTVGLLELFNVIQNPPELENSVLD